VWLAALAAWPLFAFGGAYFWTTVPLMAGAAALLVVVRPPVASPGTRTLDFALLLGLLAAASQLIPLRQDVRLEISPGLERVDRALYVDASDPASRPPSPLTVDPEATREALALAAAVIAIFWCARAMLETGGARQTIRLLTACGLTASATAILQHSTEPGLLYWTWRPINRSASPYTPFVNRNDLAAWLIMMIPLTLGYLATRVDSRRLNGAASPLSASVDDKAVWLLGGLCAMTAALLVSLSRSGLTAAAAALLVFVWMARWRLASRGVAWMLVGIALVVTIAMMYVNVDALMSRVNETLATGVGGRKEIWAATRAIIADFRITGVGVGAYARAMSVYQPPHVFAFNHAHDEYLQVLAEGGVVLAGCAALAVSAGAATAAQLLRRDQTSMFWTRAGAISAIVAIAVQSVWETGLRMPANAVLFAICCAIALQRGGGQARDS